jgi:hypothetical protein
MKKILCLLAVSAFLASCHYGVEEAHKTLNANETYKSDKKEYSVNRANPDGMEATAPSPASEPAQADTSKTSEKPAEKPAENSAKEHSK